LRFISEVAVLYRRASAKDWVSIVNFAIAKKKPKNSLDAAFDFVVKRKYCKIQESKWINLRRINSAAGTIFGFITRRSARRREVDLYID